MADRRIASVGLRLIAAAALTGAIALPATAAPMAASAPAAASPAPATPTTGTRVATVDPAKVGVPRGSRSGGAAAYGVPTATGATGGLAALRRPDASRPSRNNLPRWQPGNKDRTSRTTATSPTGVTATRTLGSPAGIRAPLATSGAFPAGTPGLRSELGSFGLSDADNSLLYPDCSVFELCEEPPDPGVAVSKDHVVQSVNELMLLVDRETQGSRVIPNFDFFSLDNNQVAQSDPRVLYDVSRGRWLATEISSDCGHGYLHIAVSSTSDPFDVWTVYRIVFPNRVVDFPGVGTSNDTVIVSLNAYGPDPKSSDCLAPGDFEGGMLVVVDWADLVGRVASLPVTTTPPNPGLFTWRPATTAGGDPLGRLIVAIDNGSAETSDIGYATVSGTNTARNVTLSPVVNLTTTAGLAPFREPPQPHQPGDPATIDHAVDGGPTDAIAASGRLSFIATSPCMTPGSDTVRDCVRLVELATGSGPADLAIAADTVFRDPAADVYMGGVGQALDGTLYVAYSRSSRTDEISTWATWRRSYETAFNEAALVIPGGGTYSGVRWGDYVILAPDPAAPDAVWQANEVPTLDGSWFTWLSRLRPAPTGPLSGSVRINGGDEFAGETFVELALTNPKDVALTVVRIANGPETRDGVLVGGETVPVADEFPWSLGIDQPGDGPADGTRHVYVQWGDGRGHWSAVASNSIILDTTGPTIGAARPPAITASTLATTGVPITLAWGPGRDNLSGLEGYDIEINTDDAEAWEDFASTPRTAVSGRVAPGHTYRWRIRSFDALSNVSDWVETAPTRVSVIDDASTAVTYSSGWRRVSGVWKGSAHATTRTGATATFSFVGRSFALEASVGPSGASRGTLDIFVDGRHIGSFAQSAATSVAARIGFRANVTPGRHTVRLVSTNTRPVSIDAVITLR